MEIRDLMKSLGFTEYEAKTYIALLKEHPVTGYAVAKNSGVPRSKIYEVLDSLTVKGDVLVSDGNPPLYAPLPVKALIERRRREAQDSLADAEQVLSKLEASPGDRDNIWNIRGREAILQKVRECVDGAGERVLMEIWAEDYAELAPNVRAAAQRGVTVQIIAYGHIDAPYAAVYPHDMSDEITEEYGGRWIVFSADDCQVVAGTVSLGEKNQAAWTKHPGLVMPITEVIIHDLYIAELMNAHREVLEATFGKNLTDLRKKFQMKMDFLEGYR